ncbi:GNAT family N-acetyltransferase [Flavobacterium sp. PL002]|uniref:GNAT family N-acetyltransferase n=1 Tax=Flavobacterium sp. PL002 TaxID=1897058 RepID=UPI001788280E|nr:GNAT family N-acetyltransferase [Flavobacterium sp. PL002]MBE0391725.1 putative N-acetyltransferase YvbK [Flavobacterium sp. PL002]
MNPDHTVVIIPFTADLKEDIKTLNLEWLERYFKVEPKDVLMLSNPQEEIIDQGGHIFYAQYNNQIVGTVSLLKINETEYELSKMAVTDGVQGLGIGNKLVQHSIQVAQEQHLKKLVLYSNRKLTPALHLYKKHGFMETTLETTDYERADIKMELLLK